MITIRWWRFRHRSYPVAIHASCQCVCTPFSFDTTVGPQPHVAHIFGYIWDSFAPKQTSPTYGPEGWAHWEQFPKLDFGGVRQRRPIGPTAWNCHLHPSLRFSGSSNHLIHAFLAVASLGNFCPPKLLHLVTQQSVPRLFLLRLSMPPTATHQQYNSYGCSAIWRVSTFVIPLIVLRTLSFNSTGVFQSHITSDTSFHFIHPIFILSLTSACEPPQS